MPAPPLAPLLLQEVVEAPLLLPEVLQALASFACCFPLLGISLLQCKLLLGLRVLLSSTLYQFPALTLGEDVAHVGDVLAPEKLMADLQDRQNGLACLCLRREGGVIV